MAAALLAFEHHQPLWHSYWEDVVLPTLEVGYLPPILDGYRRFLETTASPCGTHLAAARTPDPYDTHPPLGDRLDRLGQTQIQRDAAPYRPPALLADVREAERMLLVSLASKPEIVPKLQTLDWDSWGATVVPLLWELSLGTRVDAFELVEISSLPTILSEQQAWWERLHHGVNVFSPEARRRQLHAWLGLWVALTLARKGFASDMPPGGEPSLVRQDLRINPFLWVEELASGKRTAESWDRLCAEVGM